MALTGLHTNWLRGSYNADRDYEIKKSESLNLRPYYDITADSVAIGYGCDLLKGDDVATIKSDLSNIGITLSDNDEQLLNGYRAGTTTLEDVLSKLILTIPSKSKASDLLAREVNRFQGKIDTALGYIMDESKEKAVLVSMAFNGGLGLLQGDTLEQSIINAVQQDDRIRAWYLIRYRRNGGSTVSQGIANRRYRESDMFGLWNSGGPNSTELEKLETFFKEMDFYNANISTLQYIRNYEAKFSPKTNEAHSSRIDETINSPDVKAYFITKYAQGQTIDGNVILATELNNNIIASTRVFTRSEVERGYLKSTSLGDLILGEKGKDFIDGGAGNDVIYGGEGNDTITGGIGDDLLMGGENNDTYIINAGDGTDTIEDKQGDNNIIKLCDKVLNFFYDEGNYQYTSADGTLTAEMEGTALVVTHIASGTKVILNEDFQWGDFGINLIDTPADPTITNTIVGTSEGDHLYDTGASDKISGYQGNDTITSNSGGNDWLQAGVGDVCNYGN